MAKDIGYFDPAQAALNGGFADLARASLDGDADLQAANDDDFVDYDERADLDDLIALGLHMAD
jgi:hypothetical protein